jgi:hypothetical protein
VADTIRECNDDMLCAEVSESGHVGMVIKFRGAEILWYVCLRPDLSIRKSDICQTWDMM